MGLIGKEMFAIDVCKLPSNASKEWSGTCSDFEKEKGEIEKTEKAVIQIQKRHQAEDLSGASEKTEEEIRIKKIEKLRQKAEKIKQWLLENEEKLGKTGKPIKSNITDNDSVKMATSHGVIQDYNGIAAADKKHQVIVGAEDIGSGSEHDLLFPMIEETEEHFKAIRKEQEIFKKIKVLADSGFHTEANMKKLEEKATATSPTNAYEKEIRLFRRRIAIKN